MQLYERLQQEVAEWENKHYKTDKYSAISEILNFIQERNYLRPPQFKALQIYWYLRIVLNTPKIFDLYKHFFLNPIDLLTAFGVQTNNPDILKLLFEQDKFWEKVKTEDSFVKKNKLETLRESLTLDYPNYILALAMGAGKTILIGTIIATEFAMALEYTNNDFMQNALVFAPGTTIIESLKEIADIPFEKIIPDRLYKGFMANLKLTYTKNGDKDIPVQMGSVFNLILTNTEKIMLRKISKNKNQTDLEFKDKEKHIEIWANARLTTIASLPHLGIFSDEAHHTHGQELEKDLKRVRSTINYLHEKKDLVCVINTTGTPYYKKQTLKDVVFWYGLAEGIQDNILKNLNNGIKCYEMAKESQTEEVINSIMEDFFKNYGNISLYNGVKSKIAFYFPTEEALNETRPIIESAMVKIGENNQTLKNTQKSTKEEIEAFNALNNPQSIYRVILLVGKGTEGWNCPSLFATALVRKVKSSNNFVLQAGTRCLRQVANNSINATIYLDESNYKVLDKELQETYGNKLSDLSDIKNNTETIKLEIKKTKLPKLIIRKKVKKIIAKENDLFELKLEKPDISSKDTINIRTLTPVFTGETRSIYQKQLDTQQITIDSTYDKYKATTYICDNYYLDYMKILKILDKLYDDEISENHLNDLFLQIENQLQNYEINEEIIEEALAIIKLKNNEGKENFEFENEAYYTEIRYVKGKEKNFAFLDNFKEKNKANFSFHYTPYNFDSMPEKDFFEQLIISINETSENIKDIYFTGGLTDINKTDVYFEYKGIDGRYHNYFPDFLIHLKNDKYYIVEIKAQNEEFDLINGKNGAKAMALKELENLNEKQFKYEMIFTNTDKISNNKLEKIFNIVKGGEL